MYIASTRDITCFIKLNHSQSFPSAYRTKNSHLFLDSTEGMELYSISVSTLKSYKFIL